MTRNAMPYNIDAIPPKEEITGAATLPLARVKKILAVDEDISAVSANASFAITIATEMFIRYFAEQAMNVVKAEKKPRRNIQYKDLANAVSRVDNLSFLEDIVPKTTTYREFKSRKARAAQDVAPLQNGQTTIGSSRPLAQRPASQGNLHPAALSDRPTTAGGPMEVNNLGSPSQPRMPNGQQLVFEHYEPNGNARKDDSDDVVMG